MTIERRAALDLRVAKAGGTPRLAGYASVFDSPSEDLGGFIEIVRLGAFTRSLQSNRTDPLALVQHMPHMILGRRSAGTLRLSEDSKGLAFEIDMPPTQAARDLLVSVERGDVRGASFAFSVPDKGDRWDMRGDKVTRELLDVDLHEVTITPTPAYADTSVAKRALDGIRRPMLFPLVAVRRRWLESI